MTTDTWPEQLYQQLRANEIEIFSYVPDAGHRVLIDRSLADAEVHSVPLTTEEEGVGVAAGAHLGGKRAVVLMQSSGVGNCINFFSLVRGGRFPLFSIISMRGDYGEGNPWQMPMGQAAQPVMEAMGIICMRVDRADELEATVDAALTMCFKTGESVAVLLTQRLLGAKAF
ncbi:MAG: phosphonopyruvate decarboxylase [Pseudomonadota bacterium]